jgi:MoaA/NifB/PqqE/SkfB family radical SAM enzyme
MQLYSAKRSLRCLRILLPAYFKSRWRPVPLWCHLYVTRKCNLSCAYCFVTDPSRQDLPTAEMKKVIDKLYSLGCRFIAFFGGEPTLRKDFPELVSYTRGRGIITYVATNGTRLTPEYIDKLGTAGIDIINLSVDSVLQFQESGKDFIRSKVVLDHLIEARKKFGFELNVNLVMTGKNIDSVIPTIQLIHEFHIPISISFIVRNTYTEKPLDPLLFFDDPQGRNRLFEVLDAIIEMRAKGYNIIDPAQYFHDIREFMINGLDWGCQAGEYYFSVDCDGKFQVCSALPPEDFTIFDIDRSYYRTLADLRRKRMTACRKDCMSNCFYDTSYFIRHPMYFIREMVR